MKILRLQFDNLTKELEKTKLKIAEINANKQNIKR